MTQNPRGAVPRARCETPTCRERLDSTLALSDKRDTGGCFDISVCRRWFREDSDRD